MKPSPKLEVKWHYRPILFTIVIMVILFTAWSYSYKIDQHVRSQGRIIPAGQTKIVQHLEGGIVSDILINEGQRINQGDILLQVSNQQARSDLAEQQISLEALKIRILRLQAEYNGDKTFNIPPDIENTNNQNIIKNEKRLFTSRRQSLIEKLSVFLEQINQKELKLEDLKAQLSNLNAEKKVSSDQLAINERLKRSNAISESRYLESKSKVKSFNTRISQVKKNIPVIQAELQEILKKIKSEKENYKTEILNEKGKVELALQQMTERLKTRHDEVDRTAIISPVNGIVNKLYVNTVGGVVQPGGDLVEIIPLDENLIVEARLSTKDRGKVWIGLPVLVKITAYDYAIYGGIDGRIIDISADSFRDERGVQFYRTRIKLEKNSISKNKPLYPGMTVEANIISGQTTILHALLKPFWRIKQNALREP